MTNQHVLIVDDEEKYRELLSETFSDLKVTTFQSGKEALASIEELHPDIIILDIVMPNMDGYEVCKTIRGFESTASTPIVFYSGMDSLEGRLKAYDLGANDYICKRNSSAEIRAKVMRLLTSEKEHLAIRQELAEGNYLLQNMQRETSALHVISQFSQASQFCHDYETLATVLFNCLFRLNLRGVVYFSNADQLYSSNGSYSKLEEEILKDAQGFGRIYSFGENRVILNWESCSLLVKDVGDNLDSLAHFMGAVQTGIRTLEIHSKMIEKIVSLETSYRQMRAQLKDQNKDTRSLKEQLFDSGLISRFDIQDEKDLDCILESYDGGFNEIFVDTEKGLKEISKLLKLINSPPAELRDLFVKRSATYINSDDVEELLF